MKLAAIAVLALLCMPAWSQGTAELSWTAPTRLTDGRLISESGGLSGFGIYMDGERVDTAAADATSHTLSDLGYGTHEFHVTAIRTVGGTEIESATSNVAVKTIVDNVPPERPTLLEVLIAWLRHVWEWFA